MSGEWVEEEVGQEGSAVVYRSGLDQPVETGCVVGFADKLIVAPQDVLDHSPA